MELFLNLFIILSYTTLVMTMMMTTQLFFYRILKINLYKKLKYVLVEREVK